MQDPARELGELCRRHGALVACAESCTAGWIGKRITDLPGSSAWFDRGFITYSDAAKQEMLGVRAETLERHGAVSAETAAEMAAGAIARSRASLAVAVTGVAGPDGGTEAKPVGTVWLAWCRRAGEPDCELRHFSGDRENVRRAAVRAALEGLVRRVGESL